MNSLPVGTVCSKAQKYSNEPLYKYLFNSGPAKSGSASFLVELRILIKTKNISKKTFQITALVLGIKR